MGMGRVSGRVMASFFSYLTTPQHLMGVLVLLLLLLVLHFVINGENPLKWWHFISTRAADGREYADIDKLGKVTGIVVGSYVVVTNKIDASFLFVYLSYVGGIAGWSAYLRSKNGSELPPKTPTP